MEKGGEGRNLPSDTVLLVAPVPSLDEVDGDMFPVVSMALVTWWYGGIVKW